MFQRQSYGNIPLLAHSYPLHIRIYFYSIASLMILFVPYFMIFEAPIHHKMSKKIRTARKFFYKEEYLQALQAYSEIIDEYPNYTKGKKEAVKAAFLLINPDVEDDPFFYLGIKFLIGMPYKEDELDEAQNCLPYTYKQKFNNLITIKTKKS